MVAKANFYMRQRTKKLAFHQLFAESKAFLLRLVAYGALALNRLPHLLKKAMAKGFKRLLNTSASPMGEEKGSPLSFDRSA